MASYSCFPQDSLDRIVPEGNMYRHDDEGPDDMPAHVKVSPCTALTWNPAATSRYFESGLQALLAPNGWKSYFEIGTQLQDYRSSHHRIIAAQTKLLLNRYKQTSTRHVGLRSWTSSTVRPWDDPAAAVLRNSLYAISYAARLCALCKLPCRGLIQLKVL